MDRKARIQENIQKVTGSVDADYMERFMHRYLMIGENETYGGVHAGSDSEHEAADFIVKELNEIGFKNVEKIAVPTSKFQFNHAAIITAGKRILPYPYAAPGTEGLTAAIVDMGTGQSSAYQQTDAEGRIVLLEAIGFIEGASLSCQIQQAELKGAAAVIVYAAEDILNEKTIRVQPPNYVPKIPVLGVCMEDAKYLKQCSAAGESVTLEADVVFTPGEGVTYEIVAEVPGEKSSEIICYSAHYDHYFRCVQDDVSAAATLLGIAKAMMTSGYKPERTIAFVFNGSHETGNAGSRYPYISGSYKLIDGPKSRWAQSIVADINFEYTALDLKQIGMLCSPEAAAQYGDFVSVLPDSLKRFKPLKEADCENYYLFAWADTISYTAKGIPCFMNDSITEQLETGTSPYIGRDHSNHDNFDVFSKMDLDINTRFFAALGIYLSGRPMLQLNFSKKVENLLTAEEEEQLASLAIDYRELKNMAKRIAVKGKDIYERALSYNACGDFGELAERNNAAVMEANRVMLDTLDKINSQDFLTVAHKKYLDNIGLLSKAAEAIQHSNFTAAEEHLKCVDIAGISRMFEREIVDFTRESISGDALKETRLWARGKELTCLDLYEVMAALKKGEQAEAFRLKQHLENALELETEALKKAVADEAAGLREVLSILETWR